MVSTVPESVTVCVGIVLWSCCAQLGIERAKTNPTALRGTFPRFMDLSPWVARAIEQGLIQTLVTCLTTARAGTHGYAKPRHAGIMVRLEEVLAEHLSRPLEMPELCALVAVSDRTLRLCCTQFLGMSPVHYVLLRRLEAVRRGLPTPIRTTQTSQ